jgi:hypothetical protein
LAPAAFAVVSTHQFALNLHVELSHWPHLYKEDLWLNIPNMIMKKGRKKEEEERSIYFEPKFIEKLYGLNHSSSLRIV